jgi:glycosyltransferase involved in cell wall biosynthesis
MNISGLLTTHAGDDPLKLQEALQSFLDQSRLPEEVVVVRDNRLPHAHEEVLSWFDSEFENEFLNNKIDDRGRGFARAKGVKVASNDWIAILDSDDISVPSRLAIQESFIENTCADVCGGYVAEFESNPDEPYTIREVPLSHNEVLQTLRLRCPVNHMTAMFRRDLALQAGNYRNLHYAEDYDLWVRMINEGACVRNIDKVLTKASAGNDLFERRGGVDLLGDEVRLQKQLVESGLISLPRGAANVIMRGTMHVLPSKIKKYIYLNHLREEVSSTI